MYPRVKRKQVETYEAGEDHSDLPSYSQDENDLSDSASDEPILDRERLYKRLRLIWEKRAKLKDKHFFIVYTLVMDTLEKLGIAVENGDSLNSKDSMHGILGMQSMLRLFDVCDFPVNARYADAGEGEGMLIAMLIVYLLINDKMGEDSVFIGFDSNPALVNVATLLLDKLQDPDVRESFTSKFKAAISKQKPKKKEESG